jgi:catechol 2,3-dioxygenase-like lactoylglutathione lyase family enzyme
MIGYVTLGANDLERGAKFYDAICGALGAKRMMGGEAEGFIAWGEAGGGAGLGLTKPFDGKPATVGNGVMAALACESAAHVDEVYKLALSLGAKDEGAAGPRQGPPGFYAGYFRDPDGNKLNAYVMGEGGKSPHVVGYMTMGTNDIARAARFYDAIAEVLGAKRVWAIESSIVWGKPGGAQLDITLPFDGKPATVGNGAMVAFECADRAQVDAVHKTALALGGSDEGAPGERWPGFYAGYFRDPDGNKLNAFIMG